MASATAGVILWCGTPEPATVFGGPRSRPATESFWRFPRTERFSSPPVTPCHSGNPVILGILSDTHDELARTRLAVQLLREAGAEALVHCGDITTPPVLAACAGLPCWFVFGNHDADAVPLLRRGGAEAGAVCLEWGGVVELAGRRVGVAHGHLTSDLRHVLADHPDYLLTGHTHAAFDRTDGPVRRINPGALHRADVYTVALLDLATGELRSITVPE
ncbi:MAG TPA: metallophosphoesterase family protein [Urbifossiella sp.]|nr:metallophosphoesterase family protein [Urbifossiella sp.]